MNPFESVWEAEILALLRAIPSLQAITILREVHPGQFPDTQLRTLQRRIRQWSGLSGPDRDVIFRQEHPVRPKKSKRWKNRGDERQHSPESSCLVM